MKKQTLEEIINNEKQIRHEDGTYGITECKKAIERDIKYRKKNLYELLGEYVKNANESIFFNRAMILACWELINEQ